MAISIVKADLESRIGAAEVSRYSLQSDANVTQAIAEAVDDARSAALNVFTSASWDAMTNLTLPSSAKGHIVWDAIGKLSAGKTRPPSVDTMVAEAAKWRGYVVGDTYRGFDGVLTRRDDAEQEGSDVTYQVPARKFDRSENDYWDIPVRD